MPDPAKPRPELEEGATGEDVRALQEALNKAAILKVDGMFGPRTKERLGEFQEANDLEPDGVAGPETWKRLDAAGK
jgi:peptidoglycan hydrolase-like protein with peptidoglycan-binding domain